MSKAHSFFLALLVAAVAAVGTMVAITMFFMRTYARIGNLVEARFPAPGRER